MIHSNNCKSEIIVTLDEILELTYKRSNEIEKYLTYIEYSKNPSQSDKELSELYGINPGTIKSWRPHIKASKPRSVDFINWATDNHFLEEIAYDSSKLNYSITPSTPRYPLLEKLTYLAWTTGELTHRWQLNISGPEDGLTELCEHINSQLNTESEPDKRTKHHKCEDFSRTYTTCIAALGTHLGRLVAPLLGYKGRKADNMQDIPAIANRTKSSKRLFLQTLNETRGFITAPKGRNKYYAISLPSLRKKNVAEQLINNVLALIKDVTGLELYHTISAYSTYTKGYQPTISTPVGEIDNYFEACMLKL